MPNEKRAHESMRPTFHTYEKVKCFALNKLHTTGKHTECSEEKNDIFLRNILYAAPVNTASKCEAHTPLLHIILYFAVDALCIQPILVDKLHCRS